MTSMTATARHPRRGLDKLTMALTAALLGACLLACVAASPAGAQVTIVGSPLSSPATLNTAEDLNYTGIDTPLPGYVFHTYHYGADTALWNTRLASGVPTAPSDGQFTTVKLEGCAQPAREGPPPLTQIHFQVLSPLPGGGAKVQLTSQAFDIPICGQNGASGSTITGYSPTNLCASAGDYLAFNDEGGYVENVYRAGVPYQVMGRAQGSTMDSFIRGDGTGNGATFSPSDKTAGDGFAVNENVELMLQATFGTGPDATHVCPGGTQGAYVPPGEAGHALRLLPQSRRVDVHHRTVVSMYCRLAAGCSGTATLSSLDGRVQYGQSPFAIAPLKTSHVEIRLTRAGLKQLRKHHHRLKALLNVSIAGRFERELLGLYGH